MTADYSTGKMPTLLNLHGGKVHMDEVGPDIKAALLRNKEEVEEDIADLADFINAYLESVRE